MSAMRPALHERHQEVLRCIREESWEAAESACRELTAGHPEFALGWYLAAQIAVRRRDLVDALAQLDKALTLEPAHAPALLLKAQCLAALGRTVQAVACAALAQEHAPPEAAFWDALGHIFSRANEHARALTAFEEAVLREPGNYQSLLNRAAVRRLLDDLAGAEEDYNRVIELSPFEFEAYRDRSELRAQTRQSNHVAQLEEVLAEHEPAWRGEVQLRYALAKEYEDLGEHEKSLEHLKRGARLRREHMRYDVKTDVATVNWISEAFPGPPPAPAPELCKDAPVFLVGLPCSGSALVEHILRSHPQVGWVGELDGFARALAEAVRRVSGARALSRREVVALSAGVDFAALGRDYIDRARAAGVTARCFIDARPLNYLYCGLIRRALPRARIMHVSRTPLAACYTIHRTLFGERCPFSYDLAELGQYYIAYRRLMAHWQRTMPGAIHEVSYDSMIVDQARETRRMLEHCGLEWDAACADPAHPGAVVHELPASSLSAVSKWRHYEAHLAGLRAQLLAAGVEVEEANL